MNRNRTPLGSLMAMAVVAVALAACSGDQSQLLAPEGASFDTSPVLVSHIDLCKFGPEGSWASFEISATGGTFLLGSEFTFTDVTANGPCKGVWRASDGETHSVTITETDRSPGTFLETIIALADDYTVDVGLKSVTLVMEPGSYAGVYFKNAGEVFENGFEGCTPGFWRQAHHYEYWSGFSPDDTWGGVFDDPGSHSPPGRNPTPFTASSRLGDVVELGGGEIFALARHAVAALLNASSPDVDYPLTVAEVVSLVNAALASEEYEVSKNQIEAYNELGCDVK